MLLKKSLALLLSVLLLLPFGGTVTAEASIELLSAGQNGDAWEVAWSSEEPVSLTSILVAGSSLESDAITNLGDMARINTSALPTGHFDITYVFSSGETVFVASGFARGGSTVLHAELVGDTLTAVLKDVNGVPMANSTIFLTIDSSIRYRQANTNANGVATFPIMIESGKQYAISVNYDGAFIGFGASYAASSYALTAGDAPTSVATTSATDAPTETETPDTTTTAALDEPTLPSGGTTAPLPSQSTTCATVRGDTTTHAADNTVAMNVISDSALLSSYTSGISAFNGKARVYVSPADYEKIAHVYGGTILGAFYHSEYSLTAEQIEATRVKNAEFNAYADVPAKAVTFRFALVSLGENGLELPIDDTSAVGDLSYTVVFPIPAELQDCTVFGIAMTGNGVTAAPTRVKPSNGTVRFTVPVLGNFTLIGFQSETDVTDEVRESSLLRGLIIGLLALGSLLLIGAVVLLYVFFLRKRREADEAQQVDAEALDEGALSMWGENGAAAPDDNDAPEDDVPPGRLF